MENDRAKVKLRKGIKRGLKREDIDKMRMKNRVSERKRDLRREEKDQKRKEERFKKIKVRKMTNEKS